jgi:hypothetical protein
MSDTFGPMFDMPLAQYDPDERCWKTSEATSLWALPMSSLTLPTWGYLHDGALFEQPTPERLTTGHGFSSLPTPTAHPENRASVEWGYPTLLDAMLPTPTAQAAKHTLDDRGPGTPDDANLWSVAGRLLPTPAVNDMGAGKDPQAWDDWTQRMKEAHGNGNGHGKSLEQEALKMLPTPRTTDGTDAPANLTPSVQQILDGTANRTPRLSEMAMDWSGVNTPPPSNAGNTSSDDQHQPQLFTETTATD